MNVLRVQHGVLVGAREPTIALHFADGRLRVELQTSVGSSINITRSPRTAVRVLRDAAIDAEVDPDEIEHAASAAVRQLLADEKVDGIQADDGRLAPLLAAGSFPILMQAKSGGLAMLDEIPVWAVDALAAPSVQASIEVAFRMKHTKRLVRSLAASLVGLGTPGSSVRLIGLALGMVPSGRLSADQLSNVIDAWSSPTTAESVPTVDQLNTARSVADAFTPERLTSLLVDAASKPDPSALWDEFWLVGQARHVLDTPMPGRIDAVHDLCLSVLPTYRQEDTSPERRPTRARQARANHGGSAARAVASARVETPKSAPRVTLQRHSGISYSPAIRAIHTTMIGDVRLLLPYCHNDLITWARELRNCLDDYIRPIEQRLTTVIAIEHRHRVIGAVEIRRRQVVQILGRSNRPLPPEIRDCVLGHLADARVTR